MNSYKREYSLLFSSIILLWIASCNTTNLFQENLFLREGDQIEMDVNEFRRLQFSSLNFTSNNKDIILPGLVNQNKETNFEDI